VAGRFTQAIELPGRWLERGTVRGEAPALLDSPLGWAGRRTLATLWFAAGEAIEAERRERLVDAARAACDAHPLGRDAGTTAVDPAVIVVRVLAPRVEPAMTLLAAVWRAWRRLAWDLEASTPRVWRT
jgi:urease accessory protein